ncbi:MAG: ArsR/SmtB family transcription factor [Myxococcaceae bacterium]
MANAAHCFAALGDPTRRRIFERLSQRPMAVGTLASGLTVTRPAVSQHLKVLRRAGLVAERQEGTRHIYRLDPRGVQLMHAYLDRFWNQALAAFAQVANEEDL